MLLKILITMNNARNGGKRGLKQIFDQETNAVCEQFSTEEVAKSAKRARFDAELLKKCGQRERRKEYAILPKSVHEIDLSNPNFITTNKNQKQAFFTVQ